MSFGGDPSLAHETQEQKVKQWLWQIAEDGRRERERRELAAVMEDSEHYHVYAMRRLVQEEEGTIFVRGGSVLAIADFRTAEEAREARERVERGGMFCQVTQCFSRGCPSKQAQQQEDDDAV